MSARIFQDKFVLAHRALVLVTGGSSEREAVTRAALTDRNPSSIRKEALALVIETIKQQDLLDRLLSEMFPKEGDYVQCLLRLVLLLATRSEGISKSKRLELDLRGFVPPELLPKVEVLLGKHFEWRSLRKLTDVSEIESVSLETHNPPWWVSYCFKLLGRGETIDLLSVKSRRRYVRINPLRNRGSVNLPKRAEELEGILARSTVPGVYLLNGPSSALSRFFSEGLFQIQDLASYFSVKASDPKPGERVLDLCAAPGAKTAALAQMMRNRGQIISVDYSARRMSTWRRETRRLSVKIAEPLTADATRLAVNHEFDLVLVDPPCTGSGIFDRNPSMRWHMTPRNLQRLSDVQDQLMESAATHIRTGGRILYCTCSLTVEENELVVSRFLKNHPQFQTRPVLREYGSPGLRGLSDCRRFYPHRDQTAGYFIARLEQTV